MMKIINGPEVTAKLAFALKDIARLTGFSEKQVTLGEAGQILKTWAGRTKVAKRETIDLRARKRVLRDFHLTQAKSVGDVSINSGVRGHPGMVWMRTEGKRGRGRPFRLAGKMDFRNFQFKPANYHWKNDDWATILSETDGLDGPMRRAQELGRASAGLARQSVIQIADNLGIKLESISGGGISAAGIAKARRAMASNGTQYINGTAQQTEEKEAGRYFVTLIEGLPYWAKIGMDRTLAGVLAGRVGLYRRNFANGAFKSVKSASRNYPWIRTELAA